jgi:DNA polymerase-3 subunit delta
LDQPSAAVRFYLFHGPDNAQSRALGNRLVEALDASRFLIEAGAMRSNPALLADEAGALSLFGGARVIWIEPAGDEIAEGLEALMAGPAPVSSVVAIAGALRKTSALLKLAEGSPAALSMASYAPEGADAERMVADLGRRFGLKIDNSIAARIAAACANDQAVVAQELAKLALFVDASPESPKALDHEALDSVGAELNDSQVPLLADLALCGDLPGLMKELTHLSAGTEAIPVIRALQRRLLSLAPARGRVDRGERVDAVMTSLGKSLFWRDKPVFARMLSRWSSADLARVSERVGAAERALIFSSAPQGATLGEELVAIARAAGRRSA